MTTTLKPTESSAMFSLQELMAIEEQRLHEEEAERRQKRLALERAAADREAARLADEARRLDEERRRADEIRQRERENEVRLAAMQQAIVEQEKIRVERQAQQATEAMRLENEREMARIAQQGSARKLRRALLGVSLGATALVAGFLGLYLGKIRPDAERRAAEATERDAAAQAALADAQARQIAFRSDIERLQRELSEATSAAQREQLNARLLALQAQAATRTPTGTAPRATTTARTPTGPTVVCEKGDPMCGKLP